MEQRFESELCAEGAVAAAEGTAAAAADCHFIDVRRPGEDGSGAGAGEDIQAWR